MKFLGILFFIFISSCSQVKVIKKDQLYSEAFLNKMRGIEEIFKSGQKDLALKKLEEIKNGQLSSVEKSYKLNLSGLILFSKDNLTDALTNFHLAQDASNQDPNLTAEIKLNLSTTYYKLSDIKKSYESLEGIKSEFLDKEELKKTYQLKYMLASTLGHKKEVVESLVYLLSEENSFIDIDGSEYKDPLVESYQALEPSDRVYILEKFEESKFLVIAYLGKIEVNNRYYSGDREGAKDVLSWLNKTFPSLENISEFSTEFTEKILSVSKLNSHRIGVVLPFTENKKDFSLQVLAGIETTLKSKKFQESDFKIFVKDNLESPEIAKEQIRDLVTKDHVALIIGGVFPNTAIAEYQEAKSRGVLFISLSPVYLPREEKNHLLIEIQGSVQSQIESMTKPECIEKLGKRVAILYPKNETGLSFADEFYRLHAKGIIELGSVGNYERTTKDFRPNIEKLLGLYYKNERNEEAQMWKNIYELEGKTRIRRIQTLPPVVEFDWVYVPAFPQEALQILPIFSYYDAKGLSYVGGPSWYNKLIIKEQRNLGKVFFSGDDPKDFNESFFQDFQTQYSRPPKLLETHAIEAGYLAGDILQGKSFTAREDFDEEFKKISNLKGLMSDYNLKENLWIKDMDFLRITQSKVIKISEDTEVETNETDKKEGEL
jgi:hypothetical protein